MFSIFWQSIKRQSDINTSLAEDKYIFFDARQLPDNCSKFNRKKSIPKFLSHPDTVYLIFIRLRVLYAAFINKQ